ncbi:MAG TPA: alpha-amylase family glycosyl hydrolase [Acidobacteriaceae bacterium]|nr:alpha-amylase family glycosyl hydrolase [Acidobacteriaceae bacterium]
MGTATAVPAPVSSTKSGMGSIPYAGGVTFRVWAKFASSVSVAGDFNSWSTTANPLAPDGTSGYWSVDVPGASVGDNYKFYIPGPGLRVDPYAYSVFKDVAAGATNLQLLWKAKVSSQTVTYDTSTGFTMPNWNEIVIYELHIGTFTTPAAGGQGTLITALNKLNSIGSQATGVCFNAIEIMPLGQFLTVTSSGYNPGYIFAVEDTYGGPDAFRDFVNAVHGLQIAVILDVVYNHLGDTDLAQFDGWSIPGIQCQWCGYSPVNGGDYFYQDASLGHTDYSHSRFDFGRTEVKDYLCDNVTRWLQMRFLDGLRFDSTINIRGIQYKGTLERDDANGIALLKEINQQVQAAQPWKLTIAEDLQNWSQITAPLTNGGYGFSAQWSDSLCFALRNAVIPSDDAARPMQPIVDALNALSGANAFKYVVYTENHDRDDPGSYLGGRLPDLIHPGQSNSWESKKRSTLAAAVILTAPAIPMIFEGQEFLAWQPFYNGEAQPAQIDWTMATTFAGITNLYRDMIHLRRNWFNNTRGLQGANLHILPIFADNMLVYHRWNQGGPGDDVIVVCNFANVGYASYAIGLPRSGMWRVRFNSDANTYDSSFSNWSSFDTTASGPALNGMPFSGNIGIGPYTCIILSQD